jgi:hypothetical protein
MKHKKLIEIPPYYIDTLVFWSHLCLTKEHFVGDMARH